MKKTVKIILWALLALAVVFCVRAWTLFGPLVKGAKSVEKLADSYGPDHCQSICRDARPSKSFDFPALVDYTDKFSNFFEDLVKLDKFGESIEDELSTSPR